MCSAESLKSLAAAFDVNAEELLAARDSKEKGGSPSQRYRNVSFVSILLGLLAAYVGILDSLLSGYISAQQSGRYFGGVRAIAGTSCAIVGMLSNKYDDKRRWQKLSKVR